MFWPGTQPVCLCEECKVTFKAHAAQQEVWGVTQNTTTDDYLILYGLEKGSQVSWGDVMLTGYEHSPFVGLHCTLRNLPLAMLFQAQSKRGSGVDKTFPKRPQSQDLAHEGRGMFSVVPTLQRPNIFRMSLTFCWFLFYLLVVLVILSVLQMHINFSCRLYSLSQAES